MLETELKKLTESVNELTETNKALIEALAQTGSPSPAEKPEKDSDEDEPEEKPTRRRRTRAAKDEEEDEPEEEEADDVVDFAEIKKLSRKLMRNADKKQDVKDALADYDADSINDLKKEDHEDFYQQLKDIESE